MLNAMVLESACKKGEKKKMPFAAGSRSRTFFSKRASATIQIKRVVIETTGVWHNDITLRNVTMSS